MKRFVIYALSDPRTGEIRYVGKSCNGLKRARSHSYPGVLRRDRTRCGNWIRSLQAAGLAPVVEEIEEHVDHDALWVAERFHIARFRSLGVNLTNHTDGGEGCPGKKMGPEQREKLRLVNLGNKHALGKKQVLSDEQRATLRKRAAQRSSNLVVRAKIAVTLTGKKQSLETIAKRVVSSMGKNNKPVIDSNGVVYESGKAAAKALGISRGYICGILKGYHKGRYSFSYLEK